MHTFFVPNLESQIITFPAEESSHCSRVLRLKPGSVVQVTDGMGSRAEVSLLDVDPKVTTAAILKKEFLAPRSFRLHIGIAPTKHIDRFEWFMEKATECGVEEITPVICSQSERTVIKPERLHKVLVAAMKQSQRAWLPVLNKAVTFKTFVRDSALQSPLYIAHCAEGEKRSLRHIYSAGDNALILIGPEGDFSTGEIQMALDAGFKAISLGENRLRTETAGLVASMAINFLNGEF